MVQVSESKRLDADARKIATDVVVALQPFANPDLFHRNFSEFAQHVASDRFGILAILSSTLRTEYPEPTLTTDEIEEIARGIDELGQFVQGTQIDGNLKKLLLSHLAYMAWAIRNIEILGVEAVYAAFGPALFSARQAAVAKRESIDEDAKSKRRVFERITDCARRHSN